MTFKEKSRKKTNEKSITKADTYTFTDVVDKACEELMERQVIYSLRRIKELKDCLSGLEQELDDFLSVSPL